MASVNPVIGSWYEDLQERQLFKVVTVDEDAETVLIQYFDGNIEEIDADSWEQMQLEEIEAPEDWSGPFDNLDPDDLGDTEMFLRSGGWPSSRATFDDYEE